MVGDIALPLVWVDIFLICPRVVGKLVTAPVASFVILVLLFVSYVFESALVTNTLNLFTLLIS